MDISYNHCRMYRVDIHPEETDQEQVVLKFVDYIERGNVKYYVGKVEYGDKTGKPHFQMCMWFDDEPNYAYYKTNIQKKPWVRKGKNACAFTKRKKETLESYSIKGEGQLITNLTEEQIAGIKPWEEPLKKSIDKYEYILNYTKKLLKDKNTEEYVSVENCQSYNTEYTFFPSESKDGSENKNSTTQEPYEYGDRLDASDKLDILVFATKEYFRKFNIIMTKKTQLKIMLATKMYSYRDYTINNFKELFSQYSL